MLGEHSCSKENEKWEQRSFCKNWPVLGTAVSKLNRIRPSPPTPRPLPAPRGLVEPDDGLERAVEKVEQIYSAIGSRVREDSSVERSAPSLIRNLQ